MTKIECMVKDCPYNDKTLKNGGICQAEKIELIWQPYHYSGLECLTGLNAQTRINSNG